MTQGLSHITFIVSDLDRTEKMLETVFDARRIYDSGDEMFSTSKERFFDIGGVWIATMLGEPLSTKTYNHVAFKISEEEVSTCVQRITSLGLNIEEGRPRVKGEGQSIYFYDHDNHLFELHTGTLDERLRRYGQD